MCSGDTLVFTCIVNDIPEATVTWRRNGNAVTIQQNQLLPSINDFTLSMGYNATSRELVTTATSQSGASMQLNGTTIGCSADAVSFMIKTINIAGIDLYLCIYKPINQIL